MFRQVEVIRQRPANGSGASARRGYVRPIQSISSPCRYVFTGLIALGHAKKLDSFYWQFVEKRWPYFDTPLIPAHQVWLSKNIAKIGEQ